MITRRQNVYVRQDAHRKMALRLAEAFVTDPVGVVRALPGHIRMQVWHDDVADDSEPSWHEHMHELLGRHGRVRKLGR